MQFAATDLSTITRARGTASIGTSGLRSIPKNHPTVTLSPEFGSGKRIAFGAALVQASLRCHVVGVEKVPLRVDQRTPACAFGVAPERLEVGRHGNVVCIGETRILIDGNAVEAAACLCFIAVAWQVTFSLRSFRCEDASATKALSMIFQSRIAVVIALTPRCTLLNGGIVELQLGLKRQGPVEGSVGVAARVYEVSIRIDARRLLDTRPLEK
jgi:hypothetical protein